MLTVQIFGIVTIPTQLVVVPFFNVPFYVKAHAWARHGFAGPEALVPFHLLPGSTSWYLPALAYASDRHLTDVISVMSRQSRVTCMSTVSVI